LLFRQSASIAGKGFLSNQQTGLPGKNAYEQIDAAPMLAGILAIAVIMISTDDGDTG
jgi:hypothetical protein